MVNAMQKVSDMAVGKLVYPMVIHMMENMNAVSEMDRGPTDLKMVLATLDSIFKTKSMARVFFFIQMDQNMKETG